jgi:hypothetical protein
MQTAAATIRFALWCAAGATVVALTGPSARALTVTLAECDEGADFVRNAALSRDNGMRAADFLGRLEGDLAAIRTVPATLRWFARDADDEALLRAAATDVFESPRRAGEHHDAFLALCRARVTLEHGVRSHAAPDR